jgi:hypothetical protein
MNPNIKRMYEDILQGREVVSTVLNYLPSFSSYSVAEDESTIEVYSFCSMQDYEL